MFETAHVGLVCALQEVTPDVNRQRTNLIERRKAEKSLTEQLNVANERRKRTAQSTEVSIDLPADAQDGHGPCCPNTWFPGSVISLPPPGSNCVVLFMIYVLTCSAPLLCL